MEHKADTKKQQLINRLEEIFQFPNGDLDFGIYKVYKYKRDYIKKFLYGSDDENIKSIDQIIDDAFSELESLGLEKLEKELEDAKKEVVNSLGEDALQNNQLLPQTKVGRKYLQLKEEYQRQKSNSKLSEDTKINIYNHLYNFFSKYYKDGDFIPLRRWGKDKHIIFYNGQEVFFHWATKDMYYIKSGEIFKEYSFTVDNKVKVIFKVIQAQDTKGNQKADEKRFFFFKDLEVKSLNEIVVYFEYRAIKEDEKEKYGSSQKTQENINEDTKKVLEKKLKKDFPILFKKKDDEEILFKHLKKFTHKNRFDFFIHKNLKDFLLKELDFYIKNSVLHFESLDDFDEFFSNTKFYVKEAQVIYKIAKQIIEFLSVLEDFQKRLWEKPKFVIDTHYVITLDRLKNYLNNENFTKLLEKILQNESQKKEWVDLGFFEKVSDISKENLYKEDESLKPLPIDTKHFDKGFKWELLNSLSEGERFSLDDALDGILVKSDNYQALNLLKHKFKDSIKTVYIDPPYNTGNDGFLYKDSYRHSSWLSMIENRLELARELMSDDGAIFVSIDDNEVDNLKKVMNGVFGEENFIEFFIWKNTDTPPSLSHFSRKNAEYILSYANNKYKITENFKGKLSKQEDAPLINKSNPKKMIKFPANTVKFYMNTGKIEKFEKEDISLLDDIFVENGVNKNSFRLEFHSKWSQDKLDKEIEKGTEFLVKSDKFSIRYKRYGSEKWLLPLKFAKFLDKTINVATNEISFKEIKDLNLSFNSYPKPVSLIRKIINMNSQKFSLNLDFFAGSGTTAHAVMKLNAGDGGNRKFLLVEMADYFDTVIIPRIKKVAYSLNWKEGKPQDADGKGIFFKYHILEQYEDTLENIQFDQIDTKIQNNPLQQNFIHLQPNHIIQYKLDTQAKKLIDIHQIENVEGYRIKVLDTKDTQKSDYKNVDLIETFIYIFGIKVEKIKKEKEYILITGIQNNLKILAVFQNKTDKPQEQLAQEINDLIDLYKPDQLYINNLAQTPIMNNNIKVKSIEGLFMEKMG